MRVFIEYTREDRVRYISHLDLMRSIQRTIRRAKIPVAFSEGYNPHPRLSFALPLSVGVTSSTEYMDIILDEKVDVYDLLQSFSDHLPQGISVTGATKVDRSVPSLMSLVGRADYRVSTSKKLSKVDQAINKFMQQKEIIYDKPGKRGIRQVDIRDGIFDMQLDDALHMDVLLCLMSGSRGNVKPEVVISKLLAFMGQDEEGISLDIHRTGIYIKHEEEWQTPLALGEV
ncbi:MAG TPA: TIGR03936 family radical SAM-associated protein [Bacillota bacterium]|nr:TIGR03936 family radical SAM-associated protein [Bacillota bacterium]